MRFNSAVMYKKKKRQTLLENANAVMALLRYRSTQSDPADVIVKENGKHANHPDESSSTRFLKMIHLPTSCITCALVTGAKDSRLKSGLNYIIQALMTKYDIR